MENESKDNAFNYFLFKIIKSGYIILVALAVLLTLVLFIVSCNVKDSTNVFNENISGTKKNADNVNQIENNILKTYKRPVAITVDGKFLVALKNREDAIEVLSRIEDKYGKGAEKVYFKENVEVEEKNIPMFFVYNINEALDKLQNPIKEPIEYVVKKNDTLWSIARKNNMKVDNILNLNPGLTDNILPGESIKLSEGKMPLTVVTEKKVVYIDDIPYETITKSDDSMYSNIKKITKDGVVGSKLVTAIVKSYNGRIIETNILNENVIKSSSPQVVTVGSKELPKTVATGVFSYPIRGYITSRYGQRWGRIHTGVDIAARMGDPIYAADGGKVIYSGWKGGYGYLIEIDHENGYITYYGHCSKLLVNLGDEIYKGQEIGLIGSTGHATGPHLHFEVRKNGIPVNPLIYLD